MEIDIENEYAIYGTRRWNTVRACVCILIRYSIFSFFNFNSRRIYGQFTPPVPKNKVSRSVTRFTKLPYLLSIKTFKIYDCFIERPESVTPCHWPQHLRNLSTRTTFKSSFHKLSLRSSTGLDRFRRMRIKVNGCKLKNILLTRQLRDVCHAYLHGTTLSDFL